ncbi:MAG: ABC transporter permease [Clostridia bacterium]|nr:ABC transporter permease [Clostridia bacterium]
MVAFIALLKNDAKLVLRDWKAIVLLLAMPFLFICLFTYALAPLLNKSSFMDPFNIALVDNEGTVQTRMLANQLDRLEIFKEVMRVDESEARQLLHENKIAAIIIIPAEFSNSVYWGRNKPVTVIGNKSMPLQSFVVKNVAQSAANLVSAGQSAINTIYHYNQKAGMSGEELQKEFSESTMKVLMETLSRNEMFSKVDDADNISVTPAEYFTASLMVIFLMFAGMPTMKMLVTEKSLHLTDRLRVSPIAAWQVIASKFMISIILSVVQFGLIIALTSTVFKNYWGGPVMRVLFLLCGIIFAVSSWSIFVSSIAKTSASADIIGNLGILIMAVVGGSIYPLSSMPEFVRDLSNFTINRWASEGFMIIFSGNDGLSVVNNFYALIVIGLAFLIISTAILKLRRY